MQRRILRTKPRQTAIRHNPRPWAAIKPDTDPEPALWHETPLAPDASLSNSANAGVAIEFGRFQVLLRRRQLFANGAPVELGTRAFELLLVLLEADGLLVTKEELLSRVWPGIVVSEENLKVQVSALRKALGADRDVIAPNSAAATDLSACSAPLPWRARANGRRGRRSGLCRSFSPRQAGEV